MKIKKELNKWQIIFDYGLAMEYFNKRRITFGIFNFQRFTKEGEMMSKKYYKGFVWRKTFRHPLTILRDYLEKKRF